MAAEVEATPGRMVEVSEAKARMRSAALVLFAERGYRSTSVRDVMRACNLTPGALYAHYESKERLLYDLIREGHIRLDEILTRVREENGGKPPQQLARLMYCLVMHTLKNSALARVANDDFDSLPEEMRSELADMRRRLNEYFEEAYDAGVAAELFDPRNKVLTLLSMLTSANQLTTWLRPDGPVPMEEVARWHATMLLRVAMYPKRSVGTIDDVVDKALEALPEMEIAAI